MPCCQKHIWEKVTIKGKETVVECYITKTKQNCHPFLEEKEIQNHRIQNP